MKFLGADYGVEFYLKPKWEKLKEGSIWSDAATQIFFSLSVSFGGLITMASYNEFEASVIRDTFIICLTNCFTSIFAGFGVFSFIGYLARKNCATIEQVNINQKLNDSKHALKTNFISILSGRCFRAWTCFYCLSGSYRTFSLPSGTNFRSFILYHDGYSRNGLSVRFRRCRSDVIGR